MLARVHLAALSALAVLLAGATGCCPDVFAKHYRREARRSGVTLPMALACPDGCKGATVIWGGSILKTENTDEGTEITVLEAPLDRCYRPERLLASRGRFIAGTNGFLDPAVYKPGRRVTVAGRIVGLETRPLGKTQYAYPLVDIHQIHIWPRVVYVPAYYPPYPPGWGWYGPYWGDMNAPGNDFFLDSEAVGNGGFFPSDQAGERRERGE